MLEDEKPGDDLSPDNNRVEIKSINEALDLLLKALLGANRLFVEEKDAGRRGVIEALNVIWEFLSLIPGTFDHRQPIISLLNALVSLDDGNVLPLLAPIRRTGRPRGSAARGCDKAMVAVTVSRLREAGLDTEEAYEKVARVCHKAGVTPGRGRERQVTGRTVGGWCEEVAVGGHSEAARAFDRMKQSRPGLAKAVESKGAEACATPCWRVCASPLLRCARMNTKNPVNPPS